MALTVPYDKNVPLPLSEDEAGRLESLLSYNIMDSGHEEQFDYLTQLASSIFDMPISAITFLDDVKQFAKSSQGGVDLNMRRDGSICQFVVQEGNILEITDTQEDARFINSPVVKDSPKVRYYAGAPIKDADGHVLGAFCMIDYKPNQLTAKQKKILATMAGEVMMYLELRKQNAALQEEMRSTEVRSISKELYFAKMSHELRTPLNGIIGMTGLLAETSLSPEQRNYLDTIKLSGDRLLSVVNDILDFSKMESGKMTLEFQPCSIGRLIEETFDIMSLSANQKGIELLYKVEDAVPATVLTDTNRLRQILMNLVGNAVKFTDTGEIVVEVDVEKRHESGTLCLRFLVHDSGIGIPEDKVACLFEEYSQASVETARKYGGTGLGLAIVRKLCSLLGGKVWVESKPSKGSTFGFSIEVEEITLYQSPEFEAIEQVLKGKKIIIVDSNDTSYTILCKQLDAVGAEVARASCADTIQELVQAEKHDLIFVNHHLPEVNAIEIARQLEEKNQTSNIPIVLASPIGFVPTSKEEDQMLFAEIIEKPLKYFKTLTAMGVALAPEIKESQESDKAIVDFHLGHGLSDIKGLGDIQILIADDNAVNQRLLKNILMRRNIESVVVEDGFKVLSALQGRSFPLILMDVQMPELDGLEATRRIRQNPHLEAQPIIIAVTGNSLAIKNGEYKDVGFDDYISKPYKLEEIESKLTKWLPIAIERFGLGD